MNEQFGLYQFLNLNLAVSGDSYWEEMTLKVLKIPVRRLLHCKEVLTSGERLLTLNYHQNDAARFNPTILYAPDLTSLAGLCSFKKNLGWVVM